MYRLASVISCITRQSLAKRQRAYKSNICKNLIYFLALKLEWEPNYPKSSPRGTAKVRLFFAPRWGVRPREREERKEKSRESDSHGETQQRTPNKRKWLNLLSLNETMRWCKACERKGGGLPSARDDARANYSWRKEHQCGANIWSIAQRRNGTAEYTLTLSLASSYRCVWPLTIK